MKKIIKKLGKSSSYLRKTIKKKRRDEELNDLPIKADKYRFTQLAYVDMSTGKHTVVARTNPMTRLAYDPNKDVIYVIFSP